MVETLTTQVEAPDAKEQRSASWTWLVMATAAAALASVVAVSAIYAIGSAAGVVDARVILPSMLGIGPLSFASVSLTALVATLGSGILLAGLTATLRRPIRAFRFIVSLLALASLSMPATIPGPPPGMRLLMGAMHVAVWAASVGVLATLAGGRTRRSA